jgi:molybdopterin adenylyltransferase
MFRVGVLTVSDRASRGEYEDRSGPAIRQFVGERLGGEVVESAVVADEQEQITATLRAWCDDDHLDLILTTGGTGFAARDVTPEATRTILEREAPGIAEVMRAASLKITPYAMLSRAVAGIRGGTLIINLPGSPKAVLENLETIAPMLPHGLAILRGDAGASERHGSTEERTNP